MENPELPLKNNSEISGTPEPIEPTGPEDINDPEAVDGGREQIIDRLTPEKKRLIEESFQELSQRLTDYANSEAGKKFKFGDRQKDVLKLKLARHFEYYETLDLNTLFDAVIESPKFIYKEKGSLHRLLEVHEEKTLQKIAEKRKWRAEHIGGLNPFEALFSTKSGGYYLARLLNMPHLEEESSYMSHCVGTSDSYVNRIKQGQIEILSFRRAPKVNPQTQKLEGDMPIITME